MRSESTEERGLEQAGPAASGQPQAGASVTLYQDGPYVVRGDFAIHTQDGEEIPLGRRTVALCRCGRSRTRPFCDGTHRLSQFHAPGTAEDSAVPARPPLAPRPAHAPAASQVAGNEQLREPLALIDMAQQALARSMQQAAEGSGEDVLRQTAASLLIDAATALSSEDA